MKAKVYENVLFKQTVNVKPYIQYIDTQQQTEQPSTVAKFIPNENIA